MKASRYLVSVPVTQEQQLFFNTFNRNMILVNQQRATKIHQLLDTLDQSDFDLEDVPIIAHLNQKGFILKDHEDELKTLEKVEKLVKNREDIYYVVIKPTLACNFRCIYCGQDHQTQRMNDATAESILQFIERKLPTIKLLNVTWYGGEPTMEYQRMLEVSRRVTALCQAQNKHYFYSIVTNAYLLTEAQIETLIQHAFKFFQITIDGDEEQHNQARPLASGEGTFERVFKNLMHVLTLGEGRGVKVHLRVNINEDNIDGVLPLLSRIPERYRRDMVLDLVNWFQNPVRLNFFELMKSAIELGYRRPNRKNTFAVCEASYQNIASFLPNGDAAFCSQEFNHGNCYGYVTETGDIAYTDYDAYARFQNLWSYSNPKCSNCVRLPLCMGGCKKVRLKDDTYCTKGGPSGLTLEEEITLYYLDHMKFENPAEILYE